MPNQGYFDTNGYSFLDGKLIDVAYEVHYKTVGLICKKYDHYEVITSINGVDKTNSAGIKQLTDEALKEANDNIQDDIMSEIYEREE